MIGILHEIKELYNVGTPAFTKDTMRKVGKMLAVFQKGTLEDRKSISRVLMELVLKSFDPKKHDLPQSQSDTVSAWCVHHNDARFFVAETAYLPMYVAACTRELESRPSIYGERACAFYGRLKQSFPGSRGAVESHRVLRAASTCARRGRGALRLGQGGRLFTGGTQVWASLALPLNDPALADIVALFMSTSTWKLISVRALHTKLVILATR
ncbi:hypothetical protein HD806DRAFT_521786 [Xylariaceae sp. AK1471]|nr:hypothetical protein HD806DRAFT_521786 [Xylariaceae sp. AK1471]